MEDMLAIPLSFSHILNSPYQTLVLAVTVPALQILFVAVLPEYTLSRQYLTKKV